MIAPSGDRGEDQAKAKVVEAAAGVESANQGGGIFAIVDKPAAAAADESFTELTI